MDRIQEHFHKLGFCDVWTLRKQGLDSDQIQALRHITQAYRTADAATRIYIRNLFLRRHEHCIAAFVFLCIAKLPYQAEPSLAEEICADALTALIIQDRRPDYRDWIVVFERLYHATRAVLPDPDAVFFAAAASASPDTADLIHRRIKLIHAREQSAPPAPGAAPQK
jgi:squalene cyclase